jgi:hypothetical protein
MMWKLMTNTNCSRDSKTAPNLLRLFVRPLGFMLFVAVDLFQKKEAALNISTETTARPTVYEFGSKPSLPDGYRPFF